MTTTAQTPLDTTFDTTVQDSFNEDNDAVDVDVEDNVVVVD